MDGVEEGRGWLVVGEIRAERSVHTQTQQHVGKCTWRLCRLLTATRLTRSSVVGRPRGPRRPCSLEEEEEGSVSAPATACEMPLVDGWVYVCVC